MIAHGNVMGLATGMLTLFLAFWRLNGKEKLAKVMSDPDEHAPRA